MWRLEGGYSRFLEGSRVVLRLEDPSLSHELQISPFNRRRPVELIFRSQERLRGRLPGGLRWEVSPQGRLRGLILFAGSAYLGNFRVPQEHFAVQWSVEAVVESGWRRSGERPLLNFTARSRLVHTWVVVFPPTVSLPDGLIRAWGRYRSPLDPSEVLELEEGQLVRWLWAGRLRFGLGLKWGLGRVWSLPGDPRLLRLRKELSADAGAEARFGLAAEGEFSLQLRRQRGRLELRLGQKKRRAAEGSLRAGIGSGSSFRVSGVRLPERQPLRFLTQSLTPPAVAAVNQGLRRALVRRLEITLALERSRWKQSSTLLHATWDEPGGPEFGATYSRILNGELPEPEPGFRLRGTLEAARTRRLVIHLNLLNRLGVGKSRERRREERVSVSPTGELLVETVEVLEKSFRRWDELQFLKLLQVERREAAGVSSAFRWWHGERRRFSRERFRRSLAMALHAGILDEFELYPEDAFPLRAQLILLTEFLPEGLEEVRQVEAGRLWQALVRSLELAEPERYGRGSFWRDWVDFPEVRERVDRDPVQSHLESRYPVGGRSEFERRQVAAAYRGVRRFLGLMEAWRRGEKRDLLDAFSSRMEVPVFLLFHLLCPRTLRRSAALLTGDVEWARGDPELLEDESAPTQPRG